MTYFEETEPINGICDQIKVHKPEWKVSIIRFMLLMVRCNPIQPVADRDGVSIKTLVFGDPQP